LATSGHEKGASHRQPISHVVLLNPYHACACLVRFAYGADSESSCRTPPAPWSKSASGRLGQCNPAFPTCCFEGHGNQSGLDLPRRPPIKRQYDGFYLGKRFALIQNIVPWLQNVIVGCSRVRLRVITLPPSREVMFTATSSNVPFWLLLVVNGYFWRMGQ